MLYLWCILFTTPLPTDIDECSSSLDDCSEYADCMDTDGSYECMCISGFTGNGTFCTGALLFTSSIASIQIGICT